MLPNKRMVEALQKRLKDKFYSDVASIIYRTQSGRDSLGHPTYTEVSVEVECSFNEKPTTEMWRDIGDIEQLSAEIRFTGDKPSKGDRVELESRFNRTSSDDQNYSSSDTYEIIGIMDRDVFGYICALKAVKI